MTLCVIFDPLLPARGHRGIAAHMGRNVADHLIVELGAGGVAVVVEEGVFAGLQVVLLLAGIFLTRVIDEYALIMTFSVLYFIFIFPCAVPFSNGLLHHVAFADELGYQKIMSAPTLQALGMLIVIDGFAALWAVVGKDRAHMLLQVLSLTGIILCIFHGG